MATSSEVDTYYCSAFSVVSDDSTDFSVNSSKLLNYSWQRDVVLLWHQTQTFNPAQSIVPVDIQGFAIPAQVELCKSSQSDL